MKIAVLNGSPKGDRSVTMQYVRFIGKHFPEAELTIHNVAHQCGRYERDEKAFDAVMKDIEMSDAVLWGFPVYFFLVPAPYKRFIELIRERGAESAFRNRYAAVLTTSIHFYDHTAHSYLHAICDDLEMRYAGSFSADTEDLLKDEGRKSLLMFAEDFIESIKSGTPLMKAYAPIAGPGHRYTPGVSESGAATGKKHVLIVTDCRDKESSLAGMTEYLRSCFTGQVEVINLHDVNIKGGCLGCVKCSYDNRCVYQDRDGYHEFFTGKLRKADILIFAGAITDRYLSSRWKLFFDRSFFNNHTPALRGRQIGFVISGRLSAVPHLKQILEAYTELQECGIIDFVTDECGDSGAIDRALQSFAVRAARLAESGYVKPATFLGVASGKIFRDAIYGRYRFPFRADHIYYRTHGKYDFPQNNLAILARNALLSALVSIPPIRKKLYNGEMEKEMLRPYEAVLKKA
jgi:multimeric flavodoxin WrbA